MKSIINDKYNIFSHWREHYIYNKNNNDWIKHERKLISEINKLINELVFFNDRLFNDLPLLKNNIVHNKNMNTTFNRIKTIASGYFSIDLLHNKSILNEIEKSLEYMLTIVYHDKSISTGNWFQWEISAPLSLYESLILLETDISKEIISKANKATKHIVPNPNWQHAGPGATRKKQLSEGANRVDMSLVVLFRGLFSNDQNDIDIALEAIPTVLDLVSDGNGFYADGGFIQHMNIPYIGTYGLVLLSNIAKIINALKGTTLELKDKRYDLIYKYIFSAIDPFLNKGIMLDFVSGRSIARGWDQNRQRGFAAIETWILCYESSSILIKKNLEIRIKYHLHNHLDTFLSSTENLKVKAIAKKIYNDSSIKPYKEKNGCFIFNSLNRVVYRNDDYLFAIALHSNRIGNYECNTTVGENLKGWFTGDGMTYIYDNDEQQYHNWWALLDKQFLSGTTVNDILPPLGEGRCQYTETKKDLVLIGGVSDENEGCYAADFFNHDKTLFIKKSYFMIDNNLICLGSNLINKYGNAFTTIDNRKLKPDGSNIISYDNIMLDDIHHSNTTTANNFIHIEGNTKKSSLGICILDNNPVIITKEYRKSNWCELYYDNENNMKETNVSGWTLTTKIKHSKINSYAYALLPMKSYKETIAYNKHKNIKILQQDDNAHIVEKSNNTTFIISWTTESLFVKDYEILGQCSIIINTDNEHTNFFVSPLSTDSKKIKITCKNTLNLVYNKSDDIIIDNKTIIINTSNLNQGSYHFSIKQ